MEDVNLIGKRVKLKGDHSHSGKSGKVVSFDKFIGVGQGYKVKLDDGTNAAVFDSSHIDLEVSKE